MSRSAYSDYHLRELLIFIKETFFLIYSIEYKGIKMNQSIFHWIDGQEYQGSKDHFLQLYSPITGQQTKKVYLARSKEVEYITESSKKAFQQWSAVPPIKRARLFFKLKELVEKNTDELAKIVSQEHGKLINDAKGSVQRGLEIVEYACNIPSHLKNYYSENISTDMDSYSIRQPLGVCVGISPFNFPVMIPFWSSAIAIACGNSFILKPSEKDPSASLFIAELYKKAGFPDGVFNVLQGDKDTVEELIQSENTQAISFVGSSKVAHEISKNAALHKKRVQALGSGKNHMVILPDANIDQAINQLIGAAYGSAGERCMAISVAIIVGDKSFADGFVSRLKNQASQIKMGYLDDEQADMGPLISKDHFDRVRQYIDIGVEEGAKLILDGRSYTHEEHDQGYFLQASLFDHVQKNMRIYQEEIFGPVLCVMRAENYEEAVELVNSHPFANGTAIFTRDGHIARDFTHRIQVGMVGVNVPIPVPPAFYSFGGWKNSLYGDHHMYGEEGIRFFTKLKTVTTRWSKKEIDQNTFMMPTTG